MYNLNVIEETSYLSVPKSKQYRMIMRIFFKEYEKMNFQLYKEDVLDIIHQQDEYKDYSMEQLLLDLEALVCWKNLTPIQDPGKVYTIAEYKNKQYRYVMSEYAVEIERMTVRLENLFVETGNLSTNLFGRIEYNLGEVEVLNEKSGKEIYEWWSNLQEDFKRLNQNYQDYLREFYSGKTATLLKSMEFILHKDRFIQYLNEFITEMQKYSRRIARTIQKVSLVVENSLLEKVVQSELEIPHAISEKKELREERIRENIWGRWNSFKNWFIDAPGYNCECQKILVITQDVIRNIIQNAAMIVQIQNWGMSRKDDYKKFLSLFLDAQTLEEAHCISAHVFGIQSIAHLKSNEGRDIDNINSGVYEEDPNQFCIKPRVQTYREKRKQQGFADKSMEKYLQRIEYLQSLEREKQLVMRYVKDGRVEFSQINEQIPESVRIVFLQWISQANMNQEKRGRTEYGQEYKLIKKEGYCTLHCEDGELKMPAYILEFKDE